MKSISINFTSFPNSEKIKVLGGRRNWRIGKKNFNPIAT